MKNAIYASLSPRFKKLADLSPSLHGEKATWETLFLAYLDRLHSEGNDKFPAAPDGVFNCETVMKTENKKFTESKLYAFAMGVAFVESILGKNPVAPKGGLCDKSFAKSFSFPIWSENDADETGWYIIHNGHPDSGQHQFDGNSIKSKTAFVAENAGAISDLMKDPGQKRSPLSWNMTGTFSVSSSDPVYSPEAFTPLFSWILLNYAHIRAAYDGTEAVAPNGGDVPAMKARTAPKAPKIPGVVGMSAQIAAFHVAMKSRQPSMLVGPTGCGKTHLVRKYVAWDNGERAKEGKAPLPLVVHTFHQESSPTEIIGTKTLDNGTVKWQESEFMKLFSAGGTYFADEFNFAPAGAHAPLFAALNGDDEIFVPESGKTYVRHPDFRFVAACNPASKYGGRQPVDKALASRFYVSVDFSYLAPAEERSLLLSRTEGLEKEEATHIVSAAAKLREAEKEGRLFQPFGTRDALHVAQLITEGYSIGDAIEYGFTLKSDNDDVREEIRKTVKDFPRIDIRDKEEYVVERDEAIKAADAAKAERDHAVSDNKAMYKELEALKDKAKKFEELKKALNS